MKVCCFVTCLVQNRIKILCLWIEFLKQLANTPTVTNNEKDREGNTRSRRAREARNGEGATGNSNSSREGS